MVGDHLIQLRRLADIERYAGNVKLVKRNVASHSYYVTWITMLLVYWENEKFKQRKVDELEALKMAMMHDASESVIGDIKSTVKQLSKDFKIALDNLEEQVNHDVIAPLMPKGLASIYLSHVDDYSAKKKDESMLVKAADIIDNCIECLEDMKVGNKEGYIENLEDNIRMLFEYAKTYPSVMYFLIYPSRELGIARYYTVAQYAAIESAHEFIDKYTAGGTDGN